MKKFALLLLVLGGLAAALALVGKNRTCPLLLAVKSRGVTSQTVTVGVSANVGRQAQVERQQAVDLNACRKNFLNLLKLRQDAAALKEIEKVLSVDPQDATALWAKAEVFRRSYRFAESEELLNRVLSRDPGHASCLISLSYISYHASRFEEAMTLLKRVLGRPDITTENRAMAYMLIGSVNAKRASAGGFISKIAYGTRIRGYFEKARYLAPDLSEVYLGLGTFYLLAPKIVGGNIDKAIEELETAVRLTPEFATANARLAQAYRKKGEPEKSDFYLGRARELDPENELLKEREEGL